MSPVCHPEVGNVVSRRARTLRHLPGGVNTAACTVHRRENFRGAHLEVADSGPHTPDM